MATLLEEAINAGKSDNAVMPKFLPLSTAQKISTVSSANQKSTVPDYKAGKVEKLMRGIEYGVAQMTEIAPALQLYGEEVQLGLGGYFGAKEEFVNRKKLNIATLQRNLASQQQNKAQNFSNDTLNSMPFKIGAAIPNFAMMAGVAMATQGVGLAAGLSAGAATTVGGTAGILSAVPFENVEQQSDRIKFDEKGNVNTSNITPEWARKTAGGEAFYMVGMGILEAKFGLFKNLSQWQKPIPFKVGFLKNLSVPVTTAVKSFINEGATEGMQSLLSSGIQLAEGNITMADMPDRLKQAWEEAVIGGILGGSVGVAVGVNQAHNVKTMLNEEVSKVITDPEVCEKVVDAIYDSGTAEMTNVISKELELSSELNTKHGAIYDTMQGAIYDAINNSGAFQGINEAEIAQYVSDTSKIFANQVLAEANKRGVLIDDVLKASDIKFENGKIQMQAGKDVIAETTITEEVNEEITPETEETKQEGKFARYQELQAQLSEIGKQANTKVLGENYKGKITEEQHKQIDIEANKLGYDKLWKEYSKLSKEISAPKMDENGQNEVYQSKNIIDWTDKFSGKETTDLKQVRAYIEKLIRNGNKFKTANGEWLIDIKKESSNRKQKRIKNKLANEQNYQKLDKDGQIRHNKYILELEELIRNAEYVSPPKEVKENKKNRKSFIEKYHYFKVNVKVGKTIYEIILDTEQYKGESEEKPQTVHLYNIQEKTSGTYADNAYLNKPDATNIITDNAENFNPSANNELYQEATKLYQAAYHGTPYNFDEFTLEHIGEGEGAQAHGWGLYFAGNKDVSEGYRKRLVPTEKSILYNGKSPKYIEFKSGTNNSSLLEAILYRGKQGVLNQLEQNRPFGNDTDELIDYVKSIDETKLENKTNGQLFEVDIPENDVLLDEQKKLSEQPEKVKKALSKLASQIYLDKEKYYLHIIDDDYLTFIKNVKDGIFNDEVIDYDGRDAYHVLRQILSSAKQASLLLNDNGIKGITYDGRQDGRCYVIFDDKSIQILNKLYQLKNTPKQKKVYQGAFNYADKTIELFKAADYSTLPHELAHFWLDNMWSFYKSGKASEAYTNNFKAVLDWLGVTEDQMYFTDPQQEKFARGYEKYLLNGYAPSGLIQGAFDDYDKWLQKVYNDARQLKVKLNADAIAFFDSMTTGELPEYDVLETQAEIRQKNIEQMNKDVQEARKFVVERQTEINNNGGNVITKETVPVTTEGEKRQSKAYTNQAAVLGIAEELNYNKADIAEQNKLATDFVKNNFEEARQIVRGEKEGPADILKNAIYNAYLKEMLAIGDNDAYIEALRNQSLELTRAGQEIASQRGAIENIFDSGYWIRRIENLKKMRLAENKFGAESEQALNKMNKYIQNKVEEVMPQFMDATTEEQKKIAEKLSKEIAAEFKAKPDTTLYQSMYEPSELRTRTNAYNYIYRYINGALGIELSKEQSNEIIAKTQAIQKAIETTRNRNGNPSALFFKNVSEMENYANSLEPSSALSILTSTVGRGNMLFSPKTIALNIESNIINFLTEVATRRIQNGAVNLSVDPQVIKDYLAYSREVFKTSGYQVSSMPSLDPTTQILSEKMTTTAGDRVVDKLGRFFEQSIFKYGLGAPDLFFKDMTFVDTANLLATKEAKGDSAKATKIFQDACLIEPKTAAGKRIREIAINEALIATYQNKGKISELALGIRNAINKGTGDFNIGDILSPFVKTPANVIGLGFDYSMGGLRALKNIKTIYNDIQNGTFTDTTRYSIRSLARNGLGFFVAALIAGMIDDDDYIPEYALLDAKQRELVKMKGGVFNSVKIGDKYISLDYFGPLGMPLVSILNARRGKNAKEQIWNYFQGSAYQALKLPVIGDLKQLLEGTGRTLTKDADSNIKMAEEAAIDFISSRSIPALVTDIAKMTDEFERETGNDAMKRLQSKIPVWREELPAQYNYGTGQPRTTQNPISALLAGARVKEEVSSPVIREINRLSKKDTEKSIGLSKITKAGKLSTLTDTQKINVEREFAQKYSNAVNNLMQTNYYNAIDDNAKVSAINKVRDSIRDEIKVEYGLEAPPKPKRRRRRRRR